MANGPTTALRTISMAACPLATTKGRRGCAPPARSIARRDRAYAVKDDPQPQVLLAFGLLNLNPAPCSPTT